MNIPLHLVLIDNLAPESLSEESLNHIIYSEWFRISQPVIGEAIAIDAEAIPDDLLELVNLPVPEESGFDLKKADIEQIHGLEKRWSNQKFFI